MNEAGLVWDNHACLPLRDIDEFLPQLARYRAAGVDVVTVNIGDSLVPLERMIRTAASIRHFVKANPDEYLLGATTADLRAATGERAPRRVHGRGRRPGAGRPGVAGRVPA